MLQYETTPNYVFNDQKNFNLAVSSRDSSRASSRANSRSSSRQRRDRPGMLLVAVLKLSLQERMVQETTNVFLVKKIYIGEIAPPPSTPHGSSIKTILFLNHDDNCATSMYTYYSTTFCTCIVHTDLALHHVVNVVFKLDNILEYTL